MKPFKAPLYPSGWKRSPHLSTTHTRTRIRHVAQAREPNGSLVVMPDGFLNVHRGEIISLAARYRLPAIYPWRFFPDLGGMLSYGCEQRELFRLAATYVNRILRGAKPIELPVQAPVTFELVINLKTAKSLGLTIPQSVLARADEVIQ